MRWVRVVNRSRAGEMLVRARWCESFLCRLRGLTFRRALPTGGGLVLVEASESRLATAIHMLAVFFPLGVAWLDADGRVVDLTVARPWRVYLPQHPAKFVVEGPEQMVQSLAVGDVLEFIDVTPDPPPSF